MHWLSCWNADLKISSVHLPVCHVHGLHWWMLLWQQISCGLLNTHIYSQSSVLSSCFVFLSLTSLWKSVWEDYWLPPWNPKPWYSPAVLLFKIMTSQRWRSSCVCYVMKCQRMQLEEFFMSTLGQLVDL